MMSEMDSRTPGAPEALAVQLGAALPAQHATRDADIVDLSHLVRTWLVWSWVPFLLAVAGLYFGYRNLQGFTPQYIASMIVLPNGTQSAASGNGGGVTAIAAQFGLQIGPQPISASPFDRLKLTLGSSELAATLDQKYQLMRRFYGSAWDASTGTWKRPTGVEFERQERIRAFLRQNPWMPPDLQSLAGLISGSLKFESVSGGGAFQRISVTGADGEMALWLLGTAFSEADELLRNNDRQQSVERKAYIEQELARQTLVRNQDALRSLLADELSRQVALAGNLLYSATVVEAPHLQNRRTEPNITLIFGVPTVTGFALGFFLITLVAVFRREHS